MTTAVRFGRCELTEPAAQVDLSGDVLSCSGDITAGSYDELAAKIAQLRGMVDNPDEDVFLVEFVDLPDLSGFYRGFSVSVGAGQAAMSVFRAAYSLSATRVADFAQPTIEIQTLSVRRTNAHGLAPATGYLFRRVDRPGWRMPDAAATSAVRETVDGFDLCAIEAPNATARTVSYQSDIATHYGAAATIEQAVGAEWLPVVGRQLSNVDPAGVRLSNGFQMLSVSNSGIITHGVYDPSSGAFETTAFRVFVNSGLAYDLWLDPTVVHNDPDLVSVRYSVRPANDAVYAAQGGASITISVAAGEGYATVGVELLRPLTVTSVTLQASPNQSGSTLTGGVRLGANDAAGNRWVIATPHTATVGVGPAAVTVARSTTIRPLFMIGQALNGSSALAINSEASLISQFIQAVSASSRVVSR